MSIEKELRLQVNFKNVYVIIKSNTVHSPVSIVFISPIWIAYTSRYINDNRRLKERSILVIFLCEGYEKTHWNNRHDRNDPNAWFIETHETKETIRTDPKRHFAPNKPYARYEPNEPHVVNGINCTIPTRVCLYVTEMDENRARPGTYFFCLLWSPEINVN